MLFLLCFGLDQFTEPINCIIAEITNLTELAEKSLSGVPEFMITAVNPI